MLKTSRTMSYVNTSEFRILVIGKAGNGKSTLCNAILGNNKFEVGRGMTTMTRSAEFAVTSKGNMALKVIDTPDITNCKMKTAQRKDEVLKWRLLTVPRPSAVVLCVRCDIRYTAEEFDIYKEIVKLWGDDSIKDNLVVAFTFGDRQDTPIEEELKAVCRELKSVLKDAGESYFVFNMNDPQNKSGAAYSVTEAVVRRNRGGAVAPSNEGSFPFPKKTKFCSYLVFLLIAILITATTIVLFQLLDIDDAAMATGVIGTCLALGILFVIYAKKQNHTLL